MLWELFPSPSRPEPSSVVKCSLTKPLSEVWRKFLAIWNHFYSKLLFHVWHPGVRKLSFLFFSWCARLHPCLCPNPKPTQVTGGAACVGGQLNGDPLSLPSPSLPSPSLFSCSLSSEGGGGGQEEKNTHSQPNKLTEIMQLPVYKPSETIE